MIFLLLLMPALLPFGMNRQEDERDSPRKSLCQHSPSLAPKRNVEALTLVVTARFTPRTNSLCWHNIYTLLLLITLLYRLQQSSHKASVTETSLALVLTSWGLHLMSVRPGVTPWYLIMMLSCLFIYSSLFPMVKMINAAPFAAFTSAFWGLSLKDIHLQKTLINLIFPCQAMQMMTLSVPGNTYFISVKSHWKKLQQTAIILIRKSKKKGLPWPGLVM